MDELNDIPSGRDLIPPLSPDLVLCVPNLAGVVKTAIDVVALGMDPDEAAHQIAVRLFDIFTQRIDRFTIGVLTAHMRFDEGSQN